MNGQAGGRTIGGWFRNSWNTYQEQKTQKKILRQITEQLVEVADPIIRQARRYHTVLHDPISGSMDYCSSIVDTLPGPVPLSREQYHANPLVKALFASPDELEEVLRISPEVKACQEKGTEGEVTALLTMTSHEKTIFGYQQEGELLMQNVAQQAVSFRDHRVVSIDTDIGGTKDKIMHRGLEVLAIVAMEEITTLRTRRDELREKKAYLGGLLKILKGKNHVLEMFSSPTQEKIEDYRKVEQKLSELEQELSTVRDRIATPEHSLGYLADIMKHPGDSLMMRNQSFRLDWKGVRVDDTPESGGNDIGLVEFSVGDELRRSAVLVSFSL
jgi:hypothetical protein